MKHTEYNFYTVFWPKAKIFWVLLLFSSFVRVDLFAQTDTTFKSPDSLNIRPQGNDSIIINISDTLITTDTTVVFNNGNKKKSAITSKVEYSATDSISLDLGNQKVFLFRDADIKYENIKQKAAYIEIDFNSNVLTAKPRADSSGKAYGMPEFSEGDQSFRSKEMKYNFKTRKGFIKSVITQEGKGYLHGELVKKMDNDVSNLHGGGYTTCDLDHPHFSLKFTKAKVIPNNKIVTGPAYMTIEDVPIPIILPFGLFPNKRGQTSGVVIPTYGESTERGFYLENGGYYFGISDYMELRLVGDIFSRGSWAVKPLFNYRKRYKFNGAFNFNYAINTSGVRESPQYQKRRDFQVNWTHRQDPKARPKSQFNASVKFGSSNFTRYNPVSVADHLTNTFGSSVSYTTTLGERVSFGAALEHRQNTTNKTINLTLPSVNLSVNRFYPFRLPGKASNLRWYDNISVTYSMNARNEVETYDSLLFTRNFAKGFRNGVQHSVPISLTLKVLKYFTLTNSIQLNERWYSQSIINTWVNDTLFTIENNKRDTLVGYMRTDTISGFKAIHEYSYSSGLNTNLYGMLQFKKGPVRAVRHVLRPSVGFSYRPDFGSPRLGYFRSVQSDSTGRIQNYSIFGDGRYNSVYGNPSRGKSGRLNFSLNNNLEMKVRSTKDTITGTKKIMLIESLTLGTSYDLAVDTLKWQPLSLSARTTLFKKLTVQYNARYEPYVKTDDGRTINKFEWDVNQRLFRKENSSWNFSMTYNFTSGSKKALNQGSSVVVPLEQAEEIVAAPDNYIDWNNSWNINFSYNLRYNDQLKYPERSMEHKLVQTLGFNGSVNVTPKWKLDVASGYDFETNKLSYTSLNVYRDLHCWEMRFNWIPIGYLKSWNFFIKVKAEVLQDLKLNRKKDFRDN